jgi:hypothetical protein
MKYSLLLAALLAGSAMAAETVEMTEAGTTTVTAPAPVPAATTNEDHRVQNYSTTVICKEPAEKACCNKCDEKEAQAKAKEELKKEREEETLSPYKDLRISVYGQGVAPMTTQSPAQAYALAKRAAIADAYRLIAEKVKGVRVEGQDTIKNMMVKRSTVRTYVDAMVRRANVVETTFKEGLCEVEMEIVLSHSQFAR